MKDNLYFTLLSHNRQMFPAASVLYQSICLHMNKLTESLSKQSVDAADRFITLSVIYSRTILLYANHWHKLGQNEFIKESQFIFHCLACTFLLCHVFISKYSFESSAVTTEFVRVGIMLIWLGFSILNLLAGLSSEYTGQLEGFDLR